MSMKLESRKGEHGKRGGMPEAKKEHQPTSIHPGPLGTEAKRGGVALLHDVSSLRNLMSDPANLTRALMDPAFRVEAVRTMFLRRIERNQTQNDVADELGVTASMIVRWEGSVRDIGEGKENVGGIPRAQTVMGILRWLDKTSSEKRS